MSATIYERKDKDRKLQLPDLTAILLLSFRASNQSIKTKIKIYMKNFKGKAIYNPSGKAAEYSQWACNFYVGCSNGCTYCYCKKGILAGAMGMNEPQLKKCFKDVFHAYRTFIKEAESNLEELQKHGLFFSFTTDPLLKETITLTSNALNWCMNHQIPVKILTKRTDFVRRWQPILTHWLDWRPKIAIGFTLTGHDELEPFASPNIERIRLMEEIHKQGFKTFASIEPIIDIDSSYEMIIKSHSFCDLFKIGLESSKKYSKSELQRFIKLIPGRVNGSKIYFKDSLLKTAGIDRESLPSNCVNRDFNLHDAN